MKTQSGRLEPSPPADVSVHTVCVTSARKSKRAYHRIMSGLHVPSGYLFLTLTSSTVSPLNIQRSWRCLVMRLQRRGIMKDGYIRVTEYTHSGLAHYHIIFRGRYVDQAYLGRLWESIHLAPIVYITRVRSRGRLSAYLAKYVSKDNQGRLSWSFAWLYRGFAGVWKDLKHLAVKNNVSRRWLLRYWADCCKLRQIPVEVLAWRKQQSYEKQLAKSAERHSAVRRVPNLSKQSMLITGKSILLL